MMKKNHKKILKITGIILGAVLILLLIVYFFLSSILKTSVQTIGSMVTGVPVTVERINLDPFRGTLYIRNLIVGNPQGYSSPYAFKLGEFQTALVVKSLFGDKIIVDRILIRSVELNRESNLLKSNISEIQDNVDRFTGAEKQQDTEKQETVKSKSKPLQINQLEISDITLYSIIKGQNSAAVPLILPPISLRDLGTEPEGITVGGVISNVLTSLVVNIGKAIGSGALSAGETISDGATDLGKGTVNIFKGLIGGSDKKKESAK